MQMVWFSELFWGIYYKTHFKHLSFHVLQSCTFSTVRFGYQVNHVGSVLLNNHRPCLQSCHATKQYPLLANASRKPPKKCSRNGPVFQKVICSSSNQMFPWVLNGNDKEPSPAVLAPSSLPFASNNLDASKFNVTQGIALGGAWGEQPLVSVYVVTFLNYRFLSANLRLLVVSKNNQQLRIFCRKRAQLRY